MGKEIDPEKLLDMVRSILPSRARTYARLAKAHENRSVRRSVRMTVEHEDLDTTKRDVLRESDHSDTVSWRRSADKLGHFMRWCERITRGMTEEQALAYVRRIVPANLIGDHAYAHWELHRKWSGGRRGISRKESKRRAFQSEYDRLRCHLRRAMEREPDLQGRLNAEIKSRKRFDEPRRLLFGVHDIDAFVHDILTNDNYQTERRVLTRLFSFRLAA